jgi:hypothetical protein
VILADTSIWIDFFRGTQPRLADLLRDGAIAMHPFIVAELALGSLGNREQKFALLESLWQVRVAELGEVRQLVESHTLYARDLGLIDVHLLASCLLTPGVQLWTRDAALEKAAALLGVGATLS